MRQISDPKDFGRVAVLMGGTSSEREVSLNSGGNVLDALRSQGVQAEPVDGIPALIEALGERRFDRVFNILHGHHGGGEDGVLQGLLDALGVPYTGSGVLGSALSMDKIRTKQVWMALGLPTPRYARIDKGILGDTALPSIRIVPAGEYYDYHAKYISDETQYVCPGLSGEAEAEIRALCLRAFEAAGCSGWSRVDVMRDAAGKFWLLEVNTAPGMTSHSLVPKAAQQTGIDFPTLCWRILETSFKEGRPR